MDEFALVPNNSLITATPEEGRQLAVKIARLIIKLTQPDEEKRKQLRMYGNDAMMLIAVGQTVATEFNNRCCKPLLEEVRCAMDGYYPVDCGFHNQLEALSTLQRTCQIIYCNMVEETSSGSDCGYLRCKQNTFLRLKDGTEIRLDRLISVDGKPTFGSDYGNFCSQPTQVL